MQAMQYKIILPEDYDMEIIKERVRKNGHKTDKFKDLMFKAYLISEKSAGNLVNSYCPFYLWKETEGMTDFIFNGYYDNIIDSFGWQKIEVGITARVDLDVSFSKSQYVLEEYLDIPIQNKLKDFSFITEKYNHEIGKVVVYNPDKWKYVVFTFFEERPVCDHLNRELYQILHLSQDN